MTFKAHQYPSVADDAFALSTGQKGLWAAELFNPESSAHVTGQYSEIFAALNVAAFELTSRRTIEDTEALRLCFGGPMYQPLQWVVPLGDWSLPTIDLSDEPDPHAAALLNLFGLEAAGGNIRPYDSIAQRCAAYVDELMATWPGPLILGGYSLGGALALEMAAQLRRAGRNVPVVLLLDAAVPRPIRRGWYKLSHRAAELWRFSWRDRRIWLMEQLSHRLVAARDDAQDDGDAGALIDTPGMLLLLEQALRWHSPLYDGKVLLFRAERNLRGYPNPMGTLGWDRYCTDLDVLDLPCNHAEILVEPQVLRIAAQIESFLSAG